MPSKSISHPVSFRSATKRDCAHLVLLADMAARRLASFLWGQIASPGQSPFEIGRNVILNDKNHYTHLNNWRVAEHRGQFVGALNSYTIPKLPVSAAGMKVLQPLNELKALAAGSRYLSTAAIYPEHRGKGFGTCLLKEAERIARAEDVDRMTLVVGTFNPRAYRLYQKIGYTEWDRRPFISVRKKALAASGLP